MFLRRSKPLVHLGQVFLEDLAAKKKTSYIYFSVFKTKCFISDMLKHSVSMLLSSV